VVNFNEQDWSLSNERRHEPTAAGRTVRSQLEEVWKELEDAAVGGVSEDERRTILRVLEELEESLTQAAAELRV
jgi:MarR family transcriptional regulator, organic hydroperoxide resistance regulator